MERQRRYSFSPWIRKILSQEKEMATHSSVLAWRTPGTGRPGVLRFMGLQRVGHDWATELNFVGIVWSLIHIWLSATPWTAACWLLRPPPSPRVFSNSCPLSQWCYPTISSSAVSFSFCLPSFPASRERSCKLFSVVKNKEEKKIWRWTINDVTIIISRTFFWDYIIREKNKPLSFFKHCLLKVLLKDTLSQIQSLTSETYNQ